MPLSPVDEIDCLEACTSTIGFFSFDFKGLINHRRGAGPKGPSCQVCRPPPAPRFFARPGPGFSLFRFPCCNACPATIGLPHRSPCLSRSLSILTCADCTVILVGFFFFLEAASILPTSAFTVLLIGSFSPMRVAFFWTPPSAPELLPCLFSLAAGVRLAAFSRTPSLLPPPPSSRATRPAPISFVFDAPSGRVGVLAGASLLSRILLLSPDFFPLAQKTPAPFLPLASASPPPHPALFPPRPNPKKQVTPRDYYLRAC